MTGRREAGAALSIDRRGDGFAVIGWDETAAPNGVCDTPRLERDLEAGLDDLATWSALDGLVFVATGSEAEVAGAMLGELRMCTSAAECEGVAQRTQVLAERISGLAVPSVAALQGPCRGRAFALALAADARIASGDERTFLATPEVRLGLVPGGGTTHRLPRLVGVVEALDLMRSGRQVSAAVALRLGLVDRLTTRQGLVEEALALARSLKRGRRGWRRPRAPSSFRARARHRVLAGNPVGRALFFRREKRRFHAQTRGNYPAPMRLLELVREGLAGGREAGCAHEAQLFGEIAADAQTRVQLGLFAAQEALAGVSRGVAESTQFRAIRSVGILGTGPTGAGIACASALHAGVEVRLVGRDAATREQGIARLRGMLDARVARERLTRAGRDAVLHRVRAVSGEERFKGVDLVIDAEPGSLEDKRQTLARVPGLDSGDVIYASGLALHSIAALASICPLPENVLGLRYATPTAYAPLLEVVAGRQSSPRSIATCREFGQRQGKSVIVVRDGPAFYCARILAPWFNEALWQLSEGLSIESIDWALVEFGFPAGPFARLDDLGIDVGAAFSHVVHDALGERMRPPPALARLLADGRLGRRNGRGFYSYEIRGREGRGAVDGSVYTTVRSWPALARSAGEIAQRCVLAMVNEAMYCLGEGIVECARDGDVAAVFGAGFPAFLGGPFRYVDSLGAGHVVDRLESWAAQCGDRFRPAPLLADMAKRAARFYPEEL